MKTRLMMLIAGLALAPALAAEVLLEGHSGDQAFQVEEIASGLGVPWGLAFIGDNELVISERSGRAWRLNVDSGERHELTGLPEVAAGGQGGLLDVVTGPDYATTGWLYFTYARPTRDGAVTTVARTRLDGDRLIDWEDLLITESATGTGQHFGSRIAFDDTGHLYFGVGDRGERDNGQDLTTHAGTLMRLNRDGTVPADNPFTGRADALAEIWSYGHRNPQGLAFDAERQVLWEIEHGPRGGDEINRIEAGANYGWPEVSLGKEYWGPVAVGEDSREGMVDPVKMYDPSIAPGSLVVYRGDAFPAWQGDLLAGALVLRHLNRVELNAEGEPVDEERLLEDLDERIRALAVSPVEGWLYLSTDSGRLLRMRPAD